MTVESDGSAGRGMWFVRLVVVLLALFLLVLGAWARFDPESFARWVNFPNHTHFLHDAGVFQMGIAVVLFAALRWRDVLAVALAGFVFTNTFHALNHVLDRHLGGRDSDWWLIGLMSVVGAAALVVRLGQIRAGRRRRETITESGRIR